MTTNTGMADRLIRGVIALVLILAPFLTTWQIYTTQWVVYASVLIGAVLGVTAIVGVCPLYRLIGVKTCKT